MELWQAYKTVRRHWLLVVALMLVGTLLGVVSGLMETRYYHATGTVNTGVAQANDWNGQNPRVADKQTVLTSYTLLTRVDEKLGLGGKQDVLDKAITVTRLNESNVLRIDVRWPDAARARDIANTLADEFIAYETDRLKSEAIRDVRLLQDQLEAARERLRRAQAARPTGTASDADTRAIDEEISQARQSFATVSNKIDLSRATATNPTAANSVTIIDRATLPTSAEPSTAPRTIAFGALIGLFLGMVMAVGFQYVDATPRLVEVLRTELGVPLLAVIPWERHFERRFYPALNKLSATRREAFRLLRSNLMLKRRTVAPHLHERFATKPLYAPMSLLVVADRPEAGCSSVVTNLGVSLANAGQRVLLLDTNLVDPTLHRFVQRAPTPGMNDWLLDPRRNPEELVQPTDLPNLFLMAAGGANPQASDLLAERNVAELVKAFGETYDAIVLDSPALAGSSDARLLSEAVEGIIVVVRPHGSETEERAREAVRFAGDKLAGVVLNGLELETGLMAGLSATPPTFAASPSGTHTHLVAEAAPPVPTHANGTLSGYAPGPEFPAVKTATARQARF